MKEEFKYYFQLPLKPINSIIITTNDGKRALDWISRDLELRDKVLNKLNSQSPTNINFEDKFVNNGCDIYLGNNIVMRVRGWGYLVGAGVSGLGLNTELATRIQDGFINWILKRLNNE